MHVFLLLQIMKIYDNKTKETGKQKFQTTSYGFRCKSPLLSFFSLVLSIMLFKTFLAFESLCMDVQVNVTWKFHGGQTHHPCAVTAITLQRKNLRFLR